MSQFLGKSSGSVYPDRFKMHCCGYMSRVIVGLGAMVLGLSWNRQDGAEIASEGRWNHSVQIVSMGLKLVAKSAY